MKPDTYMNGMHLIDDAKNALPWVFFALALTGLFTQAGDSRGFVTFVAVLLGAYSMQAIDRLRTYLLRQWSHTTRIERERHEKLKHAN